MRILFIVLLLLAYPPGAHTYPLDGFAYTGIKRLEYYRLMAEGKIEGRQLYPGAKLPMAKVVPRWHGPALGSLHPDVGLGNQIRQMLGDEADRYAVAVLDLSNPAHPRYAEHNADMQANVGSVGKLLVALALFQKLADLYPQDMAARERILAQTEVRADEFINTDHHKVVFWNLESQTVETRPLRIGDQASLWEYLDWMLSASSNAAASMVMKQLILLGHFGRAYPPEPAIEAEYMSTASAAELGRILIRLMHDSLVRNDLDPGKLRQGSLFTREGQRRVIGNSSYGNPRQLIKLLLRLESGKLVDAWSSREIKRLIYMTQKRIRYASHWDLNEAAVYFKSGSFYSCVPEPGFRCRKYRGNKVNRLASVAIIEAPAGDPQYHYLVVVMSNVLRKNSAVAHQTLAGRIHRMIKAIHKDNAGAD